MKISQNLIYVLLTGCLAFGFYSCSTKNDPTADESATIYLLGTSVVNGKNITTVWKNGVPTAITDDEDIASGEAIWVSKGDVYVAGHVRAANDVQHPVLWTNGVRTTLPSVNEDPNANDVVVANGHVYVGGYDGGTPVYWLDNQKVLEEGDSGAYAYRLAVSGNDVYSSGSNKKGKYVAVYWKNGKMVDLGDYSITSGARGIAVSGNDVYNIGYTDDNPAVMWKNGELHPVGGAHSFLNSIFIDGTDIYVAGSDEGNAQYWKNGSPVNLGPGIVSRLLVHNGSVYISGVNGTHAGYWKNGTWVSVTEISGSTSSGGFGIAVE